MHYKAALAKVVACHTLNWGSFSELFPDMQEADLHKKLEALQACGLEMKRIVDVGEIGWSDACRFVQEMETVLLLIVICMWATTAEDVPLTDDDLAQVTAAMNSLCAAGAQEHGRGVIDVAKRLIEEGLKSQALPSSASTLLFAYYMPAE